MALTIQLPPDLEQRAPEQATARGESVPDYILTLLRGALAPGAGNAANGEQRESARAARRRRKAESAAEEERALAALLAGIPEPSPPIPFEEIRGATRDGRLVREPNPEPARRL